MDLNEIKKLIEEDGGKIIIVEDDKPVMVITSFDDYKKIKAKPPARIATQSVAGGEKKVQKPIPKELENEELKIEDLPF